MLLVLNLPLAPLWAKLLRIPRPYLYAGILFFSSLGAYAANANTFDLFLLLVIGALGFMMRRYGLPILPGIIGVILGPFAEEKLRQALQISNGELSGLFEPISVVVYCIVALIVLWPLVRRFLPKQGGAERPRGGRARHRGGAPAHRAHLRRVGGAARRRRGRAEARLRRTGRALIRGVP